MGFHQAATDGHAHEDLHAHFIFTAASLSEHTEIYGGIRDAGRTATGYSPEAAAVTLRNLSGTHYAYRRKP
jgi:galactose-1-phosphate uridylyltransferase